MELAQPKSQKLLEQVSDAIKVKHYSSRTGKTYAYWIRQLPHLTPPIQNPFQSTVTGSPVSLR